MTKRFQCLVNSQEKSCELWLYGEIGDNWLGGISTKQFAEELKAAGNVDTIFLHINSSGGDVFQGIGIFNLLKQHSARVIVDVDGLAASISSLICMAGDEIRMAQNAMMMLHDPWVITSGTADELKQQSRLLEKVKDSLISAYTGQTGKDADEISKLMTSETWLSASEALELGFITEITAEQRAAASFDLSFFKNVPARLKAAASTPRLKRKNIQKYRREIIKHRISAL